jgi:hypothetical protein
MRIGKTANGAEARPDVELVAQPSAQPSFLGRRAALRSVGGGAALAGIALAIGSTSRVARAEAGQKLDGSWLVTIQPDGPAPAFHSLATYSPDGTVIASALPVSAAPPGLGTTRVHASASHGEWYRSGDRSFAVTFIALLADDGGVVVGTQKVSNSVTLDDGGNSLTSLFQATYTGPDGTTLAAFGGSTKANRIQVEPL